MQTLVFSEGTRFEDLVAQQLQDARRPRWAPDVPALHCPCVFDSETWTTKRMAAPKGYTVDVNGYKQTTQTYTVLPGGTKGETLRFRLPAGNKVELTDNHTHLGPKSVQVKKVGEDLHLAFPGSSLRSPDVIIEDFYPRGGKPGALVGRSAGGKAYDYAGVSGSAGLEQAGVTASLAGKPVSEWGEANAAIEPVSGRSRSGPGQTLGDLPSGGSRRERDPRPSSALCRARTASSAAATADEGGYTLGTSGLGAGRRRARGPGGGWRRRRWWMAAATPRPPTSATGR